MNTKVGVIGLGYVGLPLALAFARKYPGTVGFDLNRRKIEQIKKGVDPTDEGLSDQLRDTSLKVSDSYEILKGCNFIIVGVPTPVDKDKNPDLTPVTSACETVGKVVKGGEIIAFESTVYPGVTEDICGPIIAKVSGLTAGKDFKLAYSPERINPGDHEHTLERITKVVSGEDKATLDKVAEVYGSVITAGVHRAPSIKVAEAAKVIENTQRDLNIALMNELAIIFDRMNIATKDVLDAASTKWNFLRFTPGLVGGHCIGVDPYYLTTKAEQLGYNPQVILAGRRINDGMGAFIAQRLVKLMIYARIAPRGARVGVLGLTFKENVTDIRNSRVPDIIAELKEFGVESVAHDPYADHELAHEEYGLALSKWEDIRDLDAVVFAVSHRHYLELPIGELLKGLKPGGVVVDVKSALKREQLPKGVTYWSL
jgi:UDP-N-acetyl-D-galactosamine dehydrogenase